MSRRRIRQIIAIVALIVLLALIGAAYVNYRNTRTIGVQIDFNQAELLPAPQYLYSFSGAGQSQLVRPLGVLSADNKVLVTDSRKGAIEVFTPRGTHIATWGKGNLLVPLYVAQHPKTGDYYVTDRRKKGVFIFSKDGKFKKQFDPKLPADQLPKFDTQGFQWAPVALDFAPDGTLYVTEILNGHRMLIFAPDGTFRRSVGTAGLVNEASEGPGVFQFPNSIKVIGNEVWVADSNNRRIQVFDRAGEYKRMVITQGLPRGFDFLPKLKKEEPRRLVVIDTLAHDGTIWDARKAEKVVSFGEHGVLEGQFSYPNDTSVDARRRIFIADTANGRIQVWGWPAAANPIPTPTTPTGWLLCLSPLLLLPLLLLLRRRRYFATPDFVYALFAAGEIARMDIRRVRWEVMTEDYEDLKGLAQDGISLAELLNPVEFSESDARALQERYELSWRDAGIMAVAQRAKLFCTEDAELRRIARVLEAPVVDSEEFIARTPLSKKYADRAGDQPPTS